MRSPRNMLPNVEAPRPAAARLWRHAGAMANLTASVFATTEPVTPAVVGSTITAFLEALTLSFAMQFPAGQQTPVLSAPQRALLQALAVGATEGQLIRAKPGVDVNGELDAACLALGAATRTAAVAIALRHQLVH
ncbi:hypothetical protein AB0I28_32060 [Phytomonospora sp. NPDC050363]|uniref:hypothetical protein n=1 Tax=Phytomonospora sp. NPDC050363 TaxID=3155642 RepID=UPI0033C9AD64